MGEEHGHVYGSSNRYVLAEMDDSYVLWDLRDPGDEPAETYPATEEGFERANFEQAGFVDLVRKSGAIAYHLWIGALAVLAALWLESRLRDSTSGTRRGSTEAREGS